MNRFVSLLSAILLAVGAHAQFEVFTAMDLEKASRVTPHATWFIIT